MTSLIRFRLDNVRNIESFAAEDLGLINIFYGENGAGKTSILEALALLSRGRSFRTAKSSTLIAYGKERLVVFANSEEGRRLGYQRAENGFQIKVDGEMCRSIAVIAALLPSIILDNYSERLITGGPSVRRSFIDWGLFHVEHQSFYPVWSRYTRILKQRNQLLKRGNIEPVDIAVWDDALCKVGLQLAALRSRQLAETTVSFTALCRSLDLDFGEINLSISRGWKQDLGLSEAVQASLDRDLKFRTTHVGPHRFDVKITVNDVNASEVLSRGQTKLLSQLLYISNAIFFKEKTGQTPIMLLDDVGAELDKLNRSKLINTLINNKMQSFVTCIDQKEVLDHLPEGISGKLFHVEQGNIVSEKQI